MSSDYTIACQLVDRISFLNPEYTEEIVEEWFNQLFPNSNTSSLEIETPKVSTSDPNLQSALSFNSNTTEISPETQNLIFTLRASLFPHYLLDSELDTIIQLLGLTDTWFDDVISLLVHELYDQCCETDSTFNKLTPYWNTLHMALSNPYGWSMSKELRLEVNKIDDKLCQYQEKKSPFLVMERLLETNSDRLIFRLANNVNFYQQFLLYFAQTYFSKPCASLLNLYIGLNEKVLKFQTWKKPIPLPILQSYFTHSIHLASINNAFSYTAETPLITWSFLILEQAFFKSLLTKSKRTEHEWAWLYFFRYPSQVDLLCCLNNPDLILNFCTSSSTDWVASLNSLVKV